MGLMRTTILFMAGAWFLAGCRTTVAKAQKTFDATKVAMEKLKEFFEAVIPLLKRLVEEFTSALRRLATSGEGAAGSTTKTIAWTGTAIAVAALTFVAVYVYRHRKSEATRHARHSSAAGTKEKTSSMEAAEEVSSSLPSES